MAVSSPSRLKLFLLSGFTLLCIWVFFLRGPTFSLPMWNVDETIHAAVARTLIDGGLLYRDAIDQRTPLTYYEFAVIFRIFGHNNLWAVRCFLAASICLIAAGLFLLGRRWKGPATGIFAAFGFCALSFGLFAPGDAYAPHTEWSVIFFTTLGAVLFWHATERPAFLRYIWTGIAFAAAALSKQPALLDLAAPAMALFYFGLTHRTSWRATFLRLAGLVLGFVIPIAATAAFFFFKGALHDFYFYTWAYNLKYYGPEIDTLQRFLSPLAFFSISFFAFPVLFLASAAACLVLLVQVLQLKPADTTRTDRPFILYLLVWSLTSLAGAASGGRDFQHYYIQCLPAFALLSAWLPAGCFEAIFQRGRLLRIAGVIILSAWAWSVSMPVWQARQRPVPALDPSWRASQFVRQNTAKNESIFVWGFHPDIYLYADRKPASRFVYATFPTGMIPWTNVAPEKDTAYAVVPGSMETLLREIEINAPAFIVDCSAGPNRFFQKYPLTQFPRLQTEIRQHYAEIQSRIYLQQGFRLFILFDAYRRQSLPLSGGPASQRLSVPGITGDPSVRPEPATYVVGGSDPDGRLQRLELLVDGKSLGAVTFAPADNMEASFTVPFDRIGAGRHQLVARAFSAHADVRESAPFEVNCGEPVLAPQQRDAFVLSVYQKNLFPLEIHSPYGLEVSQSAEHTYYFAHAPSRLVYPIPAGAKRVTGGFSIRPGAYSPENPTPTDGAEFILQLVRADGSTQILLHRLIRPATEPSDRPLQSFSADLPADATGELRFIISSGPNNNSACDWTFWTDLGVEKN